MTIITIGSGAINQKATMDVGGKTVADVSSSADGTGTLTKFEVFMNVTSSTAAKMGTMELTGGTVDAGGNPEFTPRDYENIGILSAGSKQTFSGLDCSVVTGDYLALYTDGIDDYIEASGLGHTAYTFSKSGDCFGSVNTFLTYAYRTSSLYGESAPPGWTGKILGVTNPEKIMGIDVANIAKVGGV